MNLGMKSSKKSKLVLDELEAVVVSAVPDFI